MDGGDHLEDVALTNEEMWKDRMKGMLVFLACQENVRGTRLWIK